MLTIMLPCNHNAEQFIQLNAWPESTWQAGIFADFMKVICNLHFIQLQITCNIVIEIQLQLLDLKCNSITITITEHVIQLHNSITCISITEQHWLPDFGPSVAILPYLYTFMLIAQPRVFACIGPSLWNQLPPFVRTTMILSGGPATSFRYLKTCLYSRVLSHWE